ncbi:helix-turn-helix domain-containing protein [Brevibacterium sp.]|uniref:TetR/AcrR family transcriptional regulator n=1 Tax=Brevibacterium sp. TaxID=1701 RepID=UPI002810DBB5|nr:helix-turn-helix domain-containing protein [Brevibacterium sp.]
MGRPRGFDENQVLLGAAELFGERGFDAVSVDTVLASLGLSRASFYKIYGSKHRLFQMALENVCHRAEVGQVDDRAKDLVVVALLELAPISRDHRDLALRAVELCFHSDARCIGEHLVSRAVRPHDDPRPTR